MTEANTPLAPQRPPMTTQINAVLWEGPKPPEVLEATVKLMSDPDNIDLMIDLGRELSKAGLFLDAIDVYSRGIAIAPDNYLLFRHRGHRYISTRRYPEAVADLSRAAVLNPGFWETFYHLGLVHYLLGEYPLAEAAYERCLEVTETEKRLCAVIDWYYLTLMILGKVEKAKDLAASVSLDTDAGENEAYKQRIMVYREILSPEEALAELETEDDHAFCTRVYGIGMEYYFRGQLDRASDVFRSIVDRSSWWHGFAELAVVADRDRLCL